MTDNWRKEHAYHIGKVMGLDPRREWLAYRLYNDYSGWCNCREDHDVNPPCGAVLKARDTVNFILGEALSEGLVPSVDTYTPPPEPKYEWENEDLEDIEAMTFEDHADFIRAMDQEELDAFIVWRREEREKRK